MESRQDKRYAWTKQWFDNQVSSLPLISHEILIIMSRFILLATFKVRANIASKTRKQKPINI